MKLNEQGKHKLERQYSWQKAKHAKLYSDLLYTSKKKLKYSSRFSADGRGAVAQQASSYLGKIIEVHQTRFYLHSKFETKFFAQRC